MKKEFCPNCEDVEGFDIIEKEQNFYIKGEKIRTKIKIPICKNCGHELWIQEIEEENEQKKFSIYRQMKHLLSPNEIKSIRKQYSVSAVTFSKLLGFGEKTITRYENGSLQESSNDLLIKLMKNEQCFKETYNFRKNNLTEKEKEKIDKVINKNKQVDIAETNFDFYCRGNHATSCSWNNTYLGGQ